jgi:TatD DNase family protein
MQPKYIDVHCHVQFDEDYPDAEEVIARMREREVGGIVVGVDLESSQKAVVLAEKHGHLWASVGLHPNDNTSEVFDLEAYRALAVHPKVVAIGECGLDYFRTIPTAENKAIQVARLTAQIELAASVDKSLIIHSRPSKGTQDAYQDLIAILTEAKQKYPNLRGDIHFFVGGVAEAQALTALGFTISFTAVITFARDYDEVIRSIPLTSILSETDAPYVAPASRRGQRNDPLAVEEVVAKIAMVRGEDTEQVRATLVANAERLFSLR